MAFLGFGRHRDRDRERERDTREWSDNRTRDWGERRYAGQQAFGGRDPREEREGRNFYGQQHRGANPFERPEEFGQNRGDWGNERYASNREYANDYLGSNPRASNDRWQESYGPRAERFPRDRAYRGATSDDYGELYRGREEGTHGAYWSPQRTDFGDYEGSAPRGGEMSNFGAGQFRGRGPKGYKRSDERIREDVCECLTEDERIDATNVEVQVKDCEVTLTGSVNSREEKRRAEDLIDRLAGVRDINNNLRVVNEGGLIEGSQSQSTSQSTSRDAGSRH